MFIMVKKIAMLDSDSVESQISSALLSLNDANQALERAKIQQNTSNATTSLGDDKLNSAVKTAKMTYDDAVLSKEKLLKQLEDYTIKAPISGTVVTKNKKERRQSRKRFIFYFFLQLIGKQFIVLSVDFCQRFQFSYGGNL